MVVLSPLCLQKSHYNSPIGAVRPCSNFVAETVRASQGQLLGPGPGARVSRLDLKTEVPELLPRK